jgi:hypothetical protein
LNTESHVFDFASGGTFVLPRIAICGTARDAGESLIATLAAIERLQAASTNSHVVIVTNDNSDDTEQVLVTWSGARQNTTIIVCDGLADVYRDRFDRLAAARNLYLAALREQKNDYDLMAVLDMDGPNIALTPKQFVQSIAGAPDGWVGLFANQRTAYYDITALRHPSWVSSDVWVEIETASRWLNTPLFQGIDVASRGIVRRRIRRQIVKNYIYRRQYRIDADAPPIRVHSAFGGLGVYRYRNALGSQYKGRTPAGRRVCEHVDFNRLVAAHGGGLYISPILLNIAPPEYLGPGSGAPLPQHLREASFDDPI